MFFLLETHSVIRNLPVLPFFIVRKIFLRPRSAGRSVLLSCNSWGSHCKSGSGRRLKAALAFFGGLLFERFRGRKVQELREMRYEIIDTMDVILAEY